MQGMARKIKKILFIFSLAWVGFALSAAKSCCSMGVTILLFGESPEYKWSYRTNVVGEPTALDSSTEIDEVVGAVGPYSEYSYKIGEDALTDCADSNGYSPWTPKSVNLQADISSLPYGPIKLCIVGQGTNSCDQLKVQEYSRASNYRWIKTAPPEPFSITSPLTATSDSTPTLTWETSVGAAVYDLSVSSNPDCSEPFQVETGISGNGFDLSPLSDGSYYVCLNANDMHNGVTPASQSPLLIEIDSLAPASWNFIAPAGANPSLILSSAWTESDGASTYNIRVTSDAACETTVETWEQIDEPYLLMSVPAPGTYYVCGEAFDEAGNSVIAGNNGFQFTVSTEYETGAMTDGIGEIPMSTNFNYSIGNHVNSLEENSWYQSALIKMAPSNHVKLSSWIAHMDGSMPSNDGLLCGPNSEHFNSSLRIWSSLENATENPQNGNVANLVLPKGALVSRSLTGGRSQTGCPIELVEFDLSFANIILTPGVEYFLSLEMRGDANLNGVWGILGSGLVGEPEWILLDNSDGVKGIEPLTTFSQLVNPRLAVKLTGVQLP